MYGIVSRLSQLEEILHKGTFREKARVGNKRNGFKEQNRRQGGNIINGWINFFSVSTSPSPLL